MKDDFDNVYDMLEHAIEYAFEGKMQLKFYEFLKYRKTKKAEIDSFLKSSTVKEISDQVLELQEYIKEVQTTIINNYVRRMVTYQNLKQEK